MERVSNTGFKDLSRQAVAIMGLAAFTWGMASGLGLVDAGLRGIVVYFTASILAMGIRVILVRVTDFPPLSDDEKAIEKVPVRSQREEESPISGFRKNNA